ATELDKSMLKRPAGGRNCLVVLVNIRLIVEAEFDIGTQRTVLAFRAGVEVNVAAGQPGIGVVVVQAAAAVEHVLVAAEAEDVVEVATADADLNANIAADLEAGLGA